jgi:hypothetical protein
VILGGLSDIMCKPPYRRSYAAGVIQSLRNSHSATTQKGHEPPKLYCYAAYTPSQLFRFLPQK